MEPALKAALAGSVTARCAAAPSHVPATFGNQAVQSLRILIRRWAT